MWISSFNRRQPGRAIPPHTKGNLLTLRPSGTTRWFEPCKLTTHRTCGQPRDPEGPTQSRVKRSKQHKGKSGTCSRLSLQQALFFLHIVQGGRSFTSYPGHSLTHTHTRAPSVLYSLAPLLCLNLIQFSFKPSIFGCSFLFTIA